MNIWHDISESRITEEQFDALIEIPKGCKAKYELDKETGLLRLDRILYTSTVYPSNYGFIPRTYADDGDPLDVLVLCADSIFPMTIITCRPIGVINMVDGGQQDEKIIAVPINDPNYKDYNDISELPSHVFEEMMHFFEVYKALEHKVTTVKEVLHRDAAVKIVAKCINNYKVKFAKN
jgi:inorganic pyrophosphatase